MEFISSRMKIFGLESEPHFANEILSLWNETNFLELQPFIKEHYWCGNASVNVFRVVGTRHPDYANNTWLHVLMNAKRMNNINIPLYCSNPGYYQETCAKDPYMHYQSIDGGDLFIGNEGNHRTTIARFDFYKKGITNLHGVFLDDYKIDWEFKKIYDEANTIIREKGLRIYISLNKSIVERQDTVAWKLDKYKLTAKIWDAKKGEEVKINNHLEFDRYLTVLKKPRWKLWG